MPELPEVEVVRAGLARHVVGAVHLSGGIEVSSEVVHRLFDPLIEAASALGAGLDWKTSLQELAAEHAFGVPEYVIQDEGPDHQKTFTAQVRVADQLYGNGIGRSKKEAEQSAAETAYGAIAGSLGIADDPIDAAVDAAVDAAADSSPNS